jgi:glutamate formiminotransferase
VFTLAERDDANLDDAVRALANRVAELVSIDAHRGEHPRLGALDVVPFVALTESESERERAAGAARAFGTWWAETGDVPVFFYDDADAEHRDLPSLRRDAFVGRRPDAGPSHPHPRLGATAVGARKPLVAVNCVLASGDVGVARRIARGVRERDGGLPAVRALGFMLDTKHQAQVSMNLVDLDRTGVEAACVRVRDLARAEETDVVEVELVGLLPHREFGRCSEAFLSWSGLDAGSTIEARLASPEPRMA